MNQRINTGLGTIILIIISITAGVFVWKFYQQNPMPEIYVPALKQKTKKIACTMEAKLCADGSYVSRSGPNCEFAACPEKSITETADRQTYRNEKYGFALTFPETWKKYTAVSRQLDWGSDGKSDSIDFGFPAQKDGLFNISFHTKKQYDSISSSGAPLGQKLGENNGYIIVWDRAQYAANSDMEKRMSEVSDIIKTFKLIK